MKMKLHQLAPTNNHAFSIARVSLDQAQCRYITGIPDDTITFRTRY